jgi:hypothetical protein
MRRIENEKLKIENAGARALSIFNFQFSIREPEANR